MSAADVQFFFAMRCQIKLYHWQTTSYARHKATDDVIDSLDKVTDEFVEVSMGKYGRPQLPKSKQVIRVANRGEKDIVAYVRGCIKFIQGPLTKGLTPTDTDLLNLRDEMLGHLNQLLYLFTLK